MPLPSQRHRFDLPDDVTYLNCAYMSPLLRSVIDIGQRAMARKGRPWEIEPAEFFSLTEAARRAFAQLLGRPATPADIAIVPAASYGMAIACHNVPLSAGHRVLALDAEFPSTSLSWRNAARTHSADFHLVPRPADHDWTSAVLDAIDERTRVAALPHCHWIDGGRLDLARIRARLAEVGAALVLDLTQSLGAMPFDLAAVDPDFLVAAGYKWLLCPYSTGFLYVAPRNQQGAPLEHSWFTRGGSEIFSSLIEYREDWQPGARRYDVGEPANFVTLPPTIEALNQLTAWGVANIYATIAVLADDIVARGRALGLLATPDPVRARHYIGLRSPKPLPEDLPERLARDRVHVSVRGGDTIRITPHVYNDRGDVDRLFAALEPALS
jgi:selenocysteine lyase/cysteine desulfurase